ncbi:MAG TPA: hypothetical protein VFY14_12495 [Streptomyces sp.]|nr:hypothetical protein [Streptomyces sp.]
MAPGTVSGGADETQLLPPMVPAPPAGGGDADATQVIPPVPSAPERDTESTTVLRRFKPPQGAPPGPAPAASQRPAPPPAGAPYGIRPGTPADRQPPADFDGLFRSGAEPADATQQLPPFDPAAAPPPRQPSYSGGHGEGRGSGVPAAVPASAAVCRAPRSPGSSWRAAPPPDWLPGRR